VQAFFLQVKVQPFCIPSQIMSDHSASDQKMLIDTTASKRDSNHLENKVIAKEANPGVHVNWPLAVRTARRPCDMVGLEASLRFENESIFSNFKASCVNRLFVIANSEGFVLACVIPRLWNWKDYGFKKKLKDWSPETLWVHPEVRRAHLATFLYNVIEQFAIAEGQSHLKIEAPPDAEPFWRSVGYVPHNEMLESIALIREKFGLDEPILKHPRETCLTKKQFVKVLVSQTDFDIAELTELATTFKEVLSKSSNPDSEIEEQNFDCYGVENLEVAALLVVFRHATPIGVLEYATITDGVLELKNTVCLPIPSRYYKERMILTVYILPSSKTDSQQLSSLQLIHTGFVYYDELQGALFTRKVLIKNPWDRNPSANIFLVPEEIRINAAVPRGLPGIHHIEAHRISRLGITALESFFPRVISRLIGEYMAQYLPALHDTAPNKFGEWSAELQPSL
jgi:hypothetical protein